MTDRTWNLEPGHEVTVRHGPKGAKWIRDRIITDKAPTRVVVTLGDEPAPPAGNVKTFAPGVTAAQLVAAISDNTVDTILLEAGTYRVGQLSIRAQRTRPATIRPAAGLVTFDGEGGRNFLFFQGAANITLKDVTVTKYAPTGTGVIVMQDGSHHLTFDGLTMVGNAMSGTMDHLIYPAGYSAACYDITVQRCTLDGAGGGAIHTYHDPGTKNLRVLDNVIRNSYYGIIAASAGDTVFAERNAFSANRYNMLCYVQAPFFAKITATGNTPNDFVTTSGW